MKKRKIIFYLSSLTKGGAQRVIINLTEAFLEKGYDVTLVTTLQEENEYEVPIGAKRRLSDLTKEEITGSRSKNLMARFSKLRKIWKEEKPDIIISFIGKNNIMAILTAFGLSVPVAVSVRGEPTEEYYNQILRLLAKYLFSLAQGIILQTNESRAFFPKRTLTKAVVLPNPLNPVFLEENRGKEKENIIILVGRIDCNKNQKLAIDSFFSIHQKYPHFTMEIWGDGEDKAYLEAYVKELNMEDKVIFKGQTNQVKEELERAYLYILPSNTEGMPNALMEAMAMGLPCISTDCPCGGPKELIEDGVNGLLVPVKDKEALSQAMDKILSDPESAKKMGEEAAKIKERLHPKKVNQQWQEYCETLFRRE